MVRRFAKVSEDEIVAIDEIAFFYPIYLANTKTTIPLRVGEERWIYLDASRLGIYPPLFTSPSGDSCILYQLSLVSLLYTSSYNVLFCFHGFPLGSAF